VVVQCPKCGERMLLQMERCPRCQTVLGPHAPQAGAQKTTNCAKCGEQIILPMDRCPRCQTPVNYQGAQPADNFFGMGRRDRTRDRTDVGDRSAGRQERGAVEGELRNEAAEVGRNRTRSELDGFVKGPDDYTPGPAAPPTPAPTPIYNPPKPYENPYLNKANLPDPRAQFMPPVEPQRPLPGTTPRAPLQGPIPVQPYQGERIGQGAVGTFERTGTGSPATFERMGAASPGTFETMGLGSAGFGMAEFVLDNRMPELAEADQLAFEALGIDMRRLRSTFCETPQEWTEKMLGGVELSQAMRNAIIQNARDDPHVRGVFLPSQGLFVNGAAFRDPMGADKPQVVSTAIHEKIGHGFCNTFTLKGEEETRAGSALFRLASTFGLKQIDEPLYPLWVQKKNISLRSSFFLEEGFASWVQFHLMRLMMGRHPEAGYGNIPTHATTLDRLVSDLQSAEQQLSGTPIAYRSLDEYLARWLNNEAERMREEGQLDFQGTRLETAGQAAQVARSCLARMLSDGDTGPVRAQNMMMALEAADRLLSDAHSSGIQLRYEGGFLLMERLKGLFGERCVPAAVRIAGNVRYNLAAVSVDDLTKAISDPNYNTDCRLAAMLRLPAGAIPKNDVRQFCGLVNDRLGYSIPEGLGQ